MRGHRIFQVSHDTLARRLLLTFAKLPSLADTLVKWEPGDVLELDELWSFVLKKSRKRWIWIALCRRTRQGVAFVVRDRSDKTCRQLWDQIPPPDRQCATFSDFQEAYQMVFPEETHQSVGKETGLTAHIEKTLSFSKSDPYHVAVLTLFIQRYNGILKRAISQF